MASDGISTHTVVYSRNFQLPKEQSKENLHGVDVFLSAPEGKRLPIHTICVIDVSGSMGSLASGGSDKGLEGSAFSCLDLVKHSLNTLIAAMEADDMLSLVTFNTSVKVVLPTVRMDEDGKRGARTAVEDLDARAGTNIWGGLIQALKIAREYEEKTGQPSTVVLLSDGQESPSTIPIGGTSANFDRIFSECKPGTLSVHTLGYGYDVDSALLVRLAASSQGVFGFIPDATMVGTLFVNFLSTIFATRTLKLRATLRGPSAGTSAFFLRRAEAKERRHVVELGLLLQGQTRSAHLLAPVGWRGTVEFEAVLPSGPVLLASVAVEVPEDGSGAKHASPVYAREMVAYSLLGESNVATHGARAALVDRFSVVKAFASEAQAADKAFFDALLSDLFGETDATGQISKALQEKHYARWGRHYLPGLALCHAMQVSQNFKDASLQGYGGALFTRLQAAVEEIFCMLPAPMPTGPVEHVGGGGGGGGGSNSGPIAMSNFYNPRGGCFFGRCRVQLADGRFVTIADLRRGQHVRARHGAVHEIACVVVSPQQTNVDGTITMIDVGGVLLTEYHPVHRNNRWQFPIDCGVSRQVTALCVYNVLLCPGATDMLVWAPATGHHNSDAAIVVGEGLSCITLGHGITDDAVASHAFLGTDAVRSSLMAMQGWSTGQVVIDEQQTQRDPVTQRVCGWVELAA